MKVINLEFGKPYVKEALERLDKEPELVDLFHCKNKGVTIVEIR